MAEVYTYNATHLITVRDGGAEFTQCAEVGTVGSFRLALDDTAGTQAIVGHKDFTHTESACANTRTFRGFVGQRSYGRNAGNDRAPDVGASRGIDVAGEDLNAMLNFRGLTGSTANRPAETINERLTWLLAHETVTSLFVDNGRVAYPNKNMDEADYRQQFPSQVLDDLILAANGFNYYVADWGAGPELTFRNDNTSAADSSTLRISNVLADASAVTLHPFTDAVLTRDPSPVKSRIAYNHANGTVTQTRAATATTFNGERYYVVSNSNVKTDAKALRQVEEMLEQLSTEEDAIECTVRVTAAQVNLIRQGERVEAKFSHLATEGYGSAFTWFRVLERTVRPMNAEAADYEIDLKLSPQEPGTEEVVEPPAEPCADDATPSATYYPLGGNTSTSTANPSDGVIYYWRPGLPDPTTVDPGNIGKWHFPVFAAGGAGTIDYAGDCAHNFLLFMTVGNGTWTIQTERYAGVARTLYVTKGPSFGLGVYHSTITSGDAVEVEVDDATDGDCIRVVAIYDAGLACGSKWGWSQAEWQSGAGGGGGGGAGPGGSGPPPDPGDLLFDLATGSTLNPLVAAVYGPGDPGFGLDSDFMGNLSKVSVSGGVTTITATKVGAVWQSACFGTVNTFSFLYGTVKARISYPNGQGVWPALWLLEEGRVATPPEIDILEAYPGDNMLGTPGEDFISSTLHSSGGVATIQYDTGSDNTDELHDYEMVWTPDALRFYFDGELYLTITANVPSVPMYPIVNLAIGATGYRADGTTPASLTMEIEYLRVYA